MDKEKKDRIELLYRNLEYNSGAYIAAETAFPFWESAYALIIGQLFIAYFQSQSHMFIGPHMFIALFGLILSFFWFVLVSLNLQNANHIDSMLQESHRLLKEELNCTPANVHFIKIYPSPYEKARWSIWDIFWGNRPGNKPDFKKMLKSTWFYRRALPFVLFIIWSILLEMLVATIFIGHENQFL